MPQETSTLRPSTPSNVTKPVPRRNHPSLAFAEAAGAALEAPLLPLDLAAAVGAGAAGDLLLPGGKGRLRRGPGSLGGGLRECRGTSPRSSRGTTRSPSTRRRRRRGSSRRCRPTRRWQEIPFSCLMISPGLHAGSQREGGKAPDRLRLRRGAAAGLPHLVEHLEDPLRVPVDRDVELPAAGLDLLGDADQGVGPRAGVTNGSGRGPAPAPALPPSRSPRRCSGPARRGSCPGRR